MADVVPKEAQATAPTVVADPTVVAAPVPAAVVASVPVAVPTVAPTSAVSVVPVVAGSADVGKVPAVPDEGTTATAATPPVVESAKQPATPDLLGGDPPVKPEDKAAAEPAKEAVTEAVIEAIKFGEVTLPEGVIVADKKLYDEKIGAFDSKVGALAQKFKLDPETATQFRNEVLQLGLAEIAVLSHKAAQASVDARAVIQKEIDDAYVAKVSGYRQSFEGDQSLVGLDGTTRETTLWRANAVIDQYAADKGLPAEEAKKQKDALRKDLKESGLINHPGLIRLFRNVANDLVEGTPVPAMKAPEPKKSKAQALYH